MRLTDVLKRKRVKRGLPSRAKTKQEETPIAPNLVQDLFTKNTVRSGATTSTPGNSSSRPPRYSGSATRNSFLQNLNPARWGRSVQERSFNKDSANLSKSTSNSNITAGNKEKTRSWIREQVFYCFYFFYLFS